MHWYYFAGCRKRRNKDRESDASRLTLVVNDYPMNPGKKEVSFIESPLPNGLKPTLPNDTTKYVNYENFDDEYYQTQIPSSEDVNDFWSNGYENTSRQMNSAPDLVPRTLVFRDKWDPYDNESDIPFLFRFEGHDHQLTPATSLSSLASSHLVKFKLR